MNSLLKEKDCIGLVSCSNGYDCINKNDILNLISILSSLGLNAIVSNSLFKDSDNNTHAPSDRANDLISMYKDNNIKAIFDISGGDLSNEILDFINFDIINKNNKPFFGYSDVTVILNSIYKKCNIKSFNYQIRNLVKDNSKNQIINFKSSFLKGENNLFDFNYKFINGKTIEGIIIGGNIRCFLKLAGTEYMPNFDNKVLFLEALSGDINKISTYIAQLKQLGAFNKINGLILGEFTEYENNNYNIKIEDLFMVKINNNIPIIKTGELGHNYNSKAIPIGSFIKLG